VARSITHSRFRRAAGRRDADRRALTARRRTASSERSRRARTGRRRPCARTIPANPGRAGAAEKWHTELSGKLLSREACNSSQCKHLFFVEEAMLGCTLLTC